VSNETDNDLSLLTSIIQEELELARSGDGYEEKAVAESIVREKVAPMLAAKDRDVEQIRIRLAQTLNLPHSRTLDQLMDDVSLVFSGWVRMAREIGGLRRELKLTEGFRQQYAEERDEALDDVERLRSALSKALADLVVRRQALADVLGVTDTGGVSGYYRMIQDVADVRAEVEQLRKTNALMANALQGSAYDTKDVLQLRADLGEARAELAAVKANAVVLPDDVVEQIASVLADWQPGDSPRFHAANVAYLARSWRGQPDTEATELSDGAKYHASLCEKCGRPIGDHWFKRGIPTRCPDPLDTEATEQAASSTVADVVLYPPVGWLNRVDEVLRYHGAADRDGSAVGEALGTLIRSWRDDQARHSPDCGPEEWGPREATTDQAPDLTDAIIQRAVVRCADMDGVPYEECDRERQDRYRDYVTATLAELPMDVLGQLSLRPEATRQAPREPRVWREGDPEPDDVYEVSDRRGGRWSRRHDGLWVGLNKHGFARWDQLLQFTVGGLTEVIEDGAS
jgi:hypothetical protein